MRSVQLVLDFIGRFLIPPSLLERSRAIVVTLILALCAWAPGAAAQTLSITGGSISEGDSGASNLVFTISLSPASTQTVQVEFATFDGTATTSGTTPADYVTTQQALIFNPGETSKTVDVPVIGDISFEPDETLIGRIYNPGNATIATSDATGTILNDDVQPVLSIANASVVEGNSGFSQLQFVVSLDRPAGQGGITFQVSHADGTAISGGTTPPSDYVPPPTTTRTISEGATSVTVAAAVIGDTVNEANETFTVTVVNVRGATIGSAAATGTIINDDALPSLSIDDVVVAEGDAGTTSATFTVALSAASGQVVTVGYGTSDGTATVADNDYVAASGSLTFNPGQTSQTVSVTVNGDTTIESDETFSVGITGPTNATIAKADGVATISNDDAPPSLSINDVTVTEGNAGTTPATFTVTLDKPAGPGGVSFDISTSDGTATAGSDYFGVSPASRTIAAGATTWSGSVPVLGDTLNEADETFTVNVTNVVGATVAKSVGTGTITNDDLLPSVSITGGSIAEGNSGTTSLDFTVSLSTASGQSVTVDYATADGTATTADNDYTASTGTLTFAPGETSKTVSVPVVGDTAVEPDETFTVALTGPTDATLGTASATGTITNDDSLVLNPPSLPFGIVGMAYNQTVSASGGVAPYTFAVTADALPGGLVLNSSSGAISGTPTAGGSFNFTITVTDALGATASQAYIVTVNAPVIVLAPPTLSDGTVGMAYSQAISASGGTGPYSFAVTAGTLPAGLSLASDGTLSGTPTASGTFNFTVEATDSSTGTGPYTGSQAYTLVVNAPTITLTPTTLPDGSVGTAYSQAISASGGTGPYSFAVTAGTLPAGLTLASDGTLSGTPTAGGSFSFTIEATDANGATGSQAYTLQVNAPTVVVSPTTLPDGTVGTAYSQAISASGGTGPYSFAVTAGALPAGLTLASDGTLSGTPTVDGTFNFTVEATDSSTGTGPYTGSQAYTLVIRAGAPQVVDDVATVLSGQSVLIDVTANDSGTIDSIAVASGPANGQAVVNGLSVTYTPDPGFSGTDTFTYVASNAGLGSQQATVTVTVNPVPEAVSRETDAISGVEVVADLTDGATGGPFTAATLVALSPANAGTTSIETVGSGSSARYLLHFTPDAAFVGSATARFTLANAFATSAEATITFHVQARQDPSKDPDVRGLIDGQVESTRRMARTQIDNFFSRLERLHGAGRRGGFESNLSALARREDCADRDAPDQRDNRSYVEPTLEACEQRTDASVDGQADDASAAEQMPGQGARPFGVWAGGAIRSGSYDGRGGSGVGFETDGISLGGDIDINPNLSVGAGLGYGRDQNDIGDNGSRLKGEAWSYVLYGSLHGEKIFLDGLLGYQQLSYDIRRQLQGIDGTVTGDRDGDQWFGSLAVGADLASGSGVQATPYARVDVARGSLDGYTESGHPTLALQYEDMDVDSTVANLGARIEYRQQFDWGWFTPQARLEYQRELEDGGAAVIRYADLGAIGPEYLLRPSLFDRSRFVLGLGMTFDVNSHWSTRFQYRRLIGSDGQFDQSFEVNFEKEF